MDFPSHSVTIYTSQVTSTARCKQGGCICCSVFMQFPTVTAYLLCGPSTPTIHFQDSDADSPFERHIIGFDTELDGHISRAFMV